MIDKCWQLITSPYIVPQKKGSFRRNGLTSNDCLPYENRYNYSLTLFTALSSNNPLTIPCLDDCCFMTYFYNHKFTVGQVDDKINF
jgi:hypothetical protein